MQRDRMQMRQNTKRQFTNMTKHKKTKYKSDNVQKDKIQISHKMTKYEAKYNKNKIQMLKPL